MTLTFPFLLIHRRLEFAEEEILRVLREAESGETVVEVCRKHGISRACPIPGLLPLQGTTKGRNLSTSKQLSFWVLGQIGMDFDPENVGEDFSMSFDDHEDETE